MTTRLLIVQLPIRDSAEIDLSRNRLLAIPKYGRDFHDSIRLFLTDAFAQSDAGKVDGFDYGDGRHNMQIRTPEQWEPALSRAKAYLSRLGVLDDVVIALREQEPETFRVVWPENFCGEFVL